MSADRPTEEPVTADVLDLLRRSGPDDIEMLRAAGIIRGNSRTQIAGDYAEYLVASLLGGELVPRNNPGFDVRLPDGERVSVKCRSLAAVNWRHFEVRRGAIRDYDRLVLVEFRANWTISQARQFPWDETEVVRERLYRGKDRYFRHGKWRTAGQLIGLAAEQERRRRLPVEPARDENHYRLM